MRLPRIRLARALALGAALVLGITLPTFAPRAQARADVSVSVFVDALQPYGDWIDDPDYGQCWRPRVIDDDPDWRPYADGEWEYTDDGWTWMSDEPWGWATYHYGRWAELDDGAWVWVPGEEWAPAWVSWRDSDEIVGWAPLPPEAVWRPSVGFTVISIRVWDHPHRYNFCDARHFGAGRSLRPWIFSRSRNSSFFERSSNVTRIERRNARIFVGGPDIQRVSRWSGGRVQRVAGDAQSQVDWHQRNVNVRGAQTTIIAPANPSKAPVDPTVETDQPSRPPRTRTHRFDSAAAAVDGNANANANANFPSNPDRGSRNHRGGDWNGGRRFEQPSLNAAPPARTRDSDVVETPRRFEGRDRRDDSVRSVERRDDNARSVDRAQRVDRVERGDRIVRDQPSQAPHDRVERSTRSEVSVERVERAPRPQREAQPQVQVQAQPQPQRDLNNQNPAAQYKQSHRKDKQQ
ncbi:MAG: hypothetical protein JO317_00270 [Verrucomicrobiae bacterium]|nr:hypothetical protein [Verrucomicrobiae bacterium]